MKIKNSWNNETEEVTLSVSNYSNNGNLAIQLWCEDGPYATLTVNLDKLMMPNLAYVDTNNLPTAEEFILENNLGKPTGNMKMSGFCVYPEYEFNMEALTTKG